MSPMMNFHACRLRKPEDFQDGSFVTSERDHEGKMYKVVQGRLEGEDSLTDQAFRYPKDHWDEDEARSHCEDHDGILFEPAADEEDSARDPRREVRTFHLAELRVDGGGEADPVIVGKAAVYNKPSEDMGFIETIEPGFFEGVLEDDTRALFNHDPNFVMGRRPAGTLELKDGPEALSVTIKPPRTALINDLVLEPMRRGDIDQMSFAFAVKPDGDVWRIEDNMMYRTLKRGGCARLYDTSVVTYPAYAQTSAQVRSKLSELRSQIRSTEAQVTPVESEVQARHAHRRRKLQQPF